MTVPHYSKAPIIEARVDIRVRVPSGTPAGRLRELAPVGDARFPNVGEIKLSAVQFRVGEQPPLQQPLETTGWVFRGVGDKTIVQARLDGFSASRLAPYDQWEAFQGEAQQLWSRYRQLSNPEAITQISLKYVNRFDIPLPIRDFKDFFRTTPEISPDMPQGLAGFFMQLQIPYPDLQSMLVLTQTLVPPPQAGLASIVLDIELGRANNVPSEDEAIWSFLNHLRQTKNDIFEACITDAARELIR